MDRMLVAVFDSEDRAYEGTRALSELEGEGSIVVYAYAVICKNPDGTATLKKTGEPGPLGPLVGTSLGTLIRLISGTDELATGAGASLLAGGMKDLSSARVGGDFVDDVKQALRSNRFAVVAEVQEDWTSPVDSRIEAIRGTVYRRSLSEVDLALRDENVAAMQADLAGLKADYAEADIDHKGKLQERIVQLDAKIRDQLDKAEEQRQAAERETRAKIEILKAKAASVKRSETRWELDALRAEKDMQ